MFFSVCTHTEDHRGKVILFCTLVEQNFEVYTMLKSHLLSSFCVQKTHPLKSAGVYMYIQYKPMLELTTSISDVKKIGHVSHTI